MKLAYLLAQFLYTNKRLDLPGIGRFTLDATMDLESENPKHRAQVAEAIRFENNPSIQDASELISFISEKTGKMKALAASDLESHLELANQLLNIAKPFTLDGIGTLVKIKAGEFTFTPGHVLPEKFKDGFEKDIHGVARKETTEDKYQAFLSTPAIKSRWKKPVIALLILAGIALAIWGGYTISKQNAIPEDLTAPDAAAILPGTDTTSPEADSTTVVIPETKGADSVKYIVETAKATRAFYRYNQLKDTKLRNDIRIETKDSIQYTLYVRLPATMDTTRVIDSLTFFLGRKVYIER